jgi:dTDP-4-amino-4,6-dideoxygalactose transaminase
MDEMRASLGLVQLDKLAESNAARKSHVDRYKDLLSHTPALSLPFDGTSEGVKPAYHIFPVLLDDGLDRPSIMSSLRDKGVQTSIHYPSFHEFTAFKEIGLNDAPLAASISKRELTLPLFPTMTESDIATVCDSLLEVIRSK